MALTRVSFALMAVALAAFSDLDGRARADGDKTVSLTIRANSTELKLLKGEFLELKMEAGGGTGFTWQIAKNNAEILKPEGKPTVERTGKPKPGAPYLLVFRFQALAEGLNELELHYFRPFDKDKPPAKTYKLSVRIVASTKK